MYGTDFPQLYGMGLTPTLNTPNKILNSYFANLVWERNLFKHYVSDQFKLLSISTRCL